MADKAKKFRTEHIEHDTIDPRGNPIHTEGDYSFGVCPKCGHEHTLLAVVDDEVHMRSAMVCPNCGAKLPYADDVQGVVDGLDTPNVEEQNAAIRKANEEERAAIKKADEDARLAREEAVKKGNAARAAAATQSHPYVPETEVPEYADPAAAEKAARRKIKADQAAVANQGQPFDQGIDPNPVVPPPAGDFVDDTVEPRDA